MKNYQHRYFQKVFRGVLPVVLWMAGFGFAGTVEVIPDAANEGSFGMRVNLSDTSPTYVRTDLPNDELRFRVRFYIRLDGLILPEGASLRIFSANRINDAVQLQLNLEQTNGETLLSWSAREDGGGMVSASQPEKVVVGAGFHMVELDWVAASGTGYLQLWYDGAFLPGLTGLDNDQARVDYAMMGAIEGLIPGISGFIDWDDFQSQRICYIGSLNCDSHCQFDSMLPSWPNTSIANLIYFTNDACFLAGL